MSDTKKGLIVLGASGGVSSAFLLLLKKYRENFSDIILIDINDNIVNSEFISLEEEEMIFLKHDIGGSKESVSSIFSDLKSKHDCDIVLDLTDLDTEPLLAAADENRLNYLNCSLNSDISSMLEYLNSFHKFSQKYNHKSHVLTLGMNPGIVNHFLIEGVLKYGVPNEYIEVEYETGVPDKTPEKPFITWSKKQFLMESVWDPTGYCDQGGFYKELDTPAVANIEDMTDYWSPILKLDKYPRGMVVPHDEIISMSNILEIPGKFVYAIHPNSLDALEDKYKKGEKITEDDMIFLDNVSQKLSGSDLIGVWLNYDDKRVLYYSEVHHKDIVGTNATLHMVAIGVLAGLLDFIENPLLEKGVLSAHELNNERFMNVVREHMNVNVFIGK